MKKVGFNFLWMYSYYKEGMKPNHPIENELDFVADEGFNFVRLPIDYHFLLKNGDSDKFEIDEEGVAFIDEYIEECNKRGLHFNLNIHRAPGYCINSPEREKTNLWRDEAPLQQFTSLWTMFAKRYHRINSEKLSFDLVNEPCNLPPTHPCTIPDYDRVMRHVIAEIRKVTPDRVIAIDGFNGGGTAIPELADAGVIHSGRGYEPFHITHYKAEWVKGSDTWELPQYPGEVSKGVFKDINTLREFYKPWQELEKMGVTVHMGECGIYNKLPNELAIRWFEDLVTVFNENNWGYALWNFKGTFGIVEHNRPNTEYTEIKGLKVDKKMLDLMKTSL